MPPIPTSLPPSSSMLSPSPLAARRAHKAAAADAAIPDAPPAAPNSHTNSSHNNNNSLRVRRRRAPARLVLAPGLSSHCPLSTTTDVQPSGLPDLPPLTALDAVGEDAMMAQAARAYASGPVEILPHLYLSDERCAHNPATLTTYGITTIVTVASECAFPPPVSDSVVPTNRKSDHASSPSLGFTGHLLQVPTNVQVAILPPDSTSKRPWSIECYHLPWTHTHDDLATAPDGFQATNAIIASGLGLSINPCGNLLQTPYRRTTTTMEERQSNVLVHCQCGVSRSASALIAYVMQAATLGYHPDVLAPATMGMHEAYVRVKELSPVISPNCGLLFQLITWSRYLGTRSDDVPAASSQPFPNHLEPYPESHLTADLFPTTPNNPKPTIQPPKASAELSFPIPRSDCTAASSLYRSSWKLPAGLTQSQPTTAATAAAAVPPVLTIDSGSPETPADAPADQTYDILTKDAPACPSPLSRCVPLDLPNSPLCMTFGDTDSTTLLATPAVYPKA